MKISILLTVSLLCLPIYGAEEISSCCAEEEASAVIAEGSIYELDAKWTNQHKKEVTLADFAGKPVLLTMGYASCKYACPRLAADLMAIESGLTEEQRKQIAIVFVTIDPENDTPESLAAFFKERNVDQARWTGLRGDEESVLELSVAIGTRYRQLENKEFAHSNRITLLSPEGVIIHNQEGLGTDPTEMISALGKVLSTTSEKSE